MNGTTPPNGTGERRALAATMGVGTSLALLDAGEIGVVGYVRALQVSAAMFEGRMDVAVGSRLLWAVWMGGGDGSQAAAAKD